MRYSVRATACLVAALALMPACPMTKSAGRKVGVPGGAERSADLSLPIDEKARGLLLLCVAGVPPIEGDWRLMEANLDATLTQIPSTLADRYEPILAELKTGPASADDLGPAGRIGRLFEPPGATEGALDARFQGSTVPGDTLVGLFVGDREHPQYFVFYRRYPTLEIEAGKPEPTDKSCGDRLYCRLVVVNVKTTEREPR